MCFVAFVRKRRRVFLLGFVIGVVLAFLSHKTSNVRGSCRYETPKPTTYNTWFIQKEVIRELVDYDTLVYGKRRDLTEAQFLEKEVVVTCAVFVNKVNNANSIKATWGKHCNHLVFFGIIRNDSIPIVDIKANNSFHLLCDSINYLLKNYENIQWALFVQDHMFVIPENLRHYVAPFNYNVPRYLGHAQIFWRQTYNVADAGYVLSKAALLALQSKFNSSKECIAGGRYWKNEDFYLGKHLSQMGIVPEDTRDAEGRSRFLGYNLHQILLPSKFTKSSSIWKRSVYPYIQGFGCCSDKTITFHGIQGDKFYNTEYLLQHLKVFKKPGLLGNVPAPKPFPEEQVSLEFLKAEGMGNVTVSAEEYFQLWKKKISGPDTFNERLRQEHLGRGQEVSAVGFANMPHVLESMLSAVHSNESENP